MEELRQHAQNMIAEQRHFETQLKTLASRSREERDELVRAHEEEIEAWQQRAARLQAEVSALQKARREQRRQNRAVSTFLKTATAEATDLSEMARQQRQRKGFDDDASASSGAEEQHEKGLEVQEEEEEEEEQEQEQEQQAAR